MHLLHGNTSCTFIFFNIRPFYNFYCCFMLYRDFMCLTGVNSENWSSRNKFSCFLLGLTVDCKQNINLAYSIHNYLQDIFFNVKYLFLSTLIMTIQESCIPVIFVFICTPPHFEILLCCDLIPHKLYWIIFEFYENRLLCKIYLCTVVKTIIFESISRSGLPDNSKFSEGRMFSSCNSFWKRLFCYEIDSIMWRGVFDTTFYGKISQWYIRSVIL